MLLLAAGCAHKTAYTCSSSDQCVHAGVQGVCEAQGYCSFPDMSCAGGQRFEPSAGGGLGGTCVMSMPDAGVAACGALGQACCSEAPACVAGGSCQAGTCTSCVADVHFGRHFSCVLETTGTIWCAGDDGNGQLGFGVAGSAMSTRQQVRDGTNATLVSDATAVALGNAHACALRAGGAVWCWGSGGEGQLGTGSTGDQYAAMPVVKADATPLTGVVALALGDESSCALDGAGAVWCWGRDAEGELGDAGSAATSTAAQVPGLTGVAEIAVARRHACARTTAGDLWCWGQNNDGQLGDGTTTNQTSPEKVGSAAGIALGQSPYSCALGADGTATCWGSAWRGRIGNGSTNADSPGQFTKPVQVVTAPGGPPLANIAQLAAGGVSCARLTDGTVDCWGDNVHGQTGTGAGAGVPVPVAMPDGSPLAGVDRVIVGYAHACVHRTTGEVLCWGRDLDGEMGDAPGTLHGRPAPLEVSCP